MLDILKRFWKEEDGMGVVEIALIIIVLVGIAVIFKTEITNLVKNLIGKITGDANQFVS
ncbi:Flp1 family type IVb pilin [Vallitalea sp.]|jgi:Flp pilus assembly pilin Flp|uniref:Flp1 family type IVb pilin n=1 Tax=Vallitalea sp. TaxID=1882829 RepID=UPI0025D292EC|nr:Flp1 family type IVb pilin [Vallitalea sp.]MCT4688711.1 holin, BlyA family protein [Vallitalea sp.]